MDKSKALQFNKHSDKYTLLTDIILSQTISECTACIIGDHIMLFGGKLENGATNSVFHMDVTKHIAYNDVNINDEINDEKKQINEDIKLTAKELSFKAYYQKKFNGVLLKYYDKLLLNELNDIDMLMDLDSIQDLTENNLVSKPAHQKKFIRIVKTIKEERNKWILNLKKLKLYYNYIDIFDDNGIYTLNEFNYNYSNSNELNVIINDIKNQMIYLIKYQIMIIIMISIMKEKSMIYQMMNREPYFCKVF